jgi:hypothetical protein
MNIKSNRGVAFLVVLPYIVGALLVGGVLYEYHQLTAPGRNKAVADQTAQTATVSATEAAAIKLDAQKARDDLARAAADQAKSDAASQAAKNAAGKDLEIIKAALEQDQNQTPAEILATGYADAAQDALGVKFTPEQHAAFIKAILPLLKDKAALEKSVADEKSGNLSLASVNEELKTQLTASQATVNTTVTSLSKEAAAHATTAAVGMKLAKQQQSWADRENTLLDRIKALGGLSILLAVIAVIVAIKLIGTKQTLKDSVALLGHVGSLAEKAGVAVKNDIETWWEGDFKGQAKVAAVKRDLRI